MHIIEKINSYATTKPDSIACCNYLQVEKTQKLTYGQLVDYSNKLAFYLQEKLGENKKPIVVYGHKNPYMLVCFLACVKSGRAYVPVDVSVPDEHVKDIIDDTNMPLVLSVKPISLPLENAISLNEIIDIINTITQKIESKPYVRNEDFFYIILYLHPAARENLKGCKLLKAVCVTLSNGLLHWEIIINQAPVSFDLPVMDLYMSLYLGGTIWFLEKSIPADYGLLYESLKESGANVLVATPSFVDLCISGSIFNENIMPKMELFLFCRETLPNNMAEQLLSRFPRLR